MPVYFSSSHVTSPFFFLLSSPTKNAQKENPIFPSLPLRQNAQKVNQLFNHAYQVMLVILLVQKGNFAPGGGGIKGAHHL
jgi:hypothetical protein